MSLKTDEQGDVIWSETSRPPRKITLNDFEALESQVTVLYFAVGFLLGMIILIVINYD